MSFEFVPGYRVTFTLDGTTEVSLAADQVAIVYGSANLPKPVFGSVAQRAIKGIKSGTFTCSGHGEASAQPVLASLRDATGGATVAVVVTYGDTTVGPGPEAGADAFDCVIGEVNVQASADGQLEWSLSAMIDGLVTYTPPTP